jgi:hypothetical protein
MVLAGMLHAVAMRVRLASSTSASDLISDRFAMTTTTRLEKFSEQEEVFLPKVELGRRNG